MSNEPNMARWRALAELDPSEIGAFHAHTIVGHFRDARDQFEALLERLEIVWARSANLTLAAQAALTFLRDMRTPDGGCVFRSDVYDAVEASLKSALETPG